MKSAYEAPTLTIPEDEIITMQDAARGLASGKYVLVGVFLCEVVRG